MEFQGIIDVDINFFHELVQEFSQTTIEVLEEGFIEKKSEIVQTTENETTRNKLPRRCKEKKPKEIKRVKKCKEKDTKEIKTPTKPQTIVKRPQFKSLLTKEDIKNGFFDCYFVLNVDKD